MLEVTKIGLKNHVYFAPLLFEKEELPQDGLVRIGGLMDGHVCGAAAFAVEDTMAELVTVYIPEKYKRTGICLPIAPWMKSIGVRRHWRKCLVMP